MRFEQLDVWKRSCKLSVEVYRQFACCRDFGFKDQITRSALSIPSNIAEGCERLSHKDTAHFLVIAKGSTGEFKTQAYIACQIGYLEQEMFDIWWEEAEQLGAMLGALIKRYLSDTL